MKIYNTKPGIVLEKENHFYLVLNQSFASFINDDELWKKAEQLTQSLKSGNASLVKELLPTIGHNQELWACGVTYLRSKVGREEESKISGGSDFYSKVYEAERPELFFKANPYRIAGNDGLVRIRKDSTWDVPEPELTLVVTATGKIVGFTIGNDMSSRSIEGENPLYLPQAKTYDGCASVGPCILVTPNGQLPSDTKIRMRIERNGVSVFKGEVAISQMRRKPEELAGFVFRECSFPDGCLIMTGTGIVPPSNFTLYSGDTIHISIDGIGTLSNTVAYNA